MVETFLEKQQTMTNSQDEYKRAFERMIGRDFDAKLFDNETTEFPIGKQTPRYSMVSCLHAKLSIKFLKIREKNKKLY